MSETMTVLTLPPEKYRFMLKTLESFKSGIRMLGINALYKQSLLKEIHTLESILKTNKNDSSAKVAKALNVGTDTVGGKHEHVSKQS